MLHIIDCAHESHIDYIDEVNNVLKEIGAESVPQLQILNKIDLLERTKPEIEYDENQIPKRVWISAQKGIGIDLLQQAVSEILAGSLVSETIRIAPEQTRLRSKLYEKGFIEDERIDESGFYHLEIRLPKQELERLMQQGAVLEQIPELIESSDPVWVAKEQARTA